MIERIDDPIELELGDPVIEYQMWGIIDNKSGKLINDVTTFSYGPVLFDTKKEAEKYLKDISELNFCIISVYLSIGR
jgi:hypothetical protein